MMDPENPLEEQLLQALSFAKRAVAIDHDGGPDAQRAYRDAIHHLRNAQAQCASPREQEAMNAIADKYYKRIEELAALTRGDSIPRSRAVGYVGSSQVHKASETRGSKRNFREDLALSRRLQQFGGSSSGSYMVYSPMRAILVQQRPVSIVQPACPQEAMLRPFWRLYYFVASVKGGSFVTASVYLPSEAWTQPGGSASVAGLTAKVRALGALVRSVRRLAPQLPAPFSALSESPAATGGEPKGKAGGGAAPSARFGPVFDVELAQVLRSARECWGTLRGCDRRLQPWEYAKVPLKRLRGAAPPPGGRRRSLEGHCSSGAAAEATAAQSKSSPPKFQEVKSSLSLAEYVSGSPPPGISPALDVILEAAWDCGLAARAGALRSSVGAGAAQPGRGADGTGGSELRMRARSVAAGSGTSRAAPRAVENPLARATGVAYVRPRRGSVPAPRAEGSASSATASTPQVRGAVPPGVTSGPRPAAVATSLTAETLRLLGRGGREPIVPGVGGGVPAAGDVHVREYGALLVELSTDLAGLRSAVEGAVMACRSDEESAAGGVEVGSEHGFRGYQEAYREWCCECALQLSHGWRWQGLRVLACFLGDALAPVVLGDASALLQQWVAGEERKLRSPLVQA